MFKFKFEPKNNILHARKTTLETSNVVGIRSDTDRRLPMSILSCIITVAAMICIMKTELDGFLIFGGRTAEPLRYYFSNSEIKNFYLTTVFGCALICAAHALKRHSFKATAALLAVYVFYFGAHYRLVVNGFIRAANKAMYAVYAVKNRVPSQYYLSYFENDDPKRELVYFLLAVIFGLCFLLSYVIIRRCSSLWFTAAAMTAAALPLSFECFISEGCFVVLSLLCIFMYTINVQGYRRASVKNTITSFGNTLKINGKYASFSAFQQTVILFVSSLLILSVINRSVDFSDYERSEEILELGNDIIYSIDSLVSGTSLDSLGMGSSAALNNGQLSRLGDMEFTGKIMFEIRASLAEEPFYLRSFSAANYTGKRWESLKSSVYRSYGFWDIFRAAEFYPQFLNTPTLGDSFYNIELEIKNRNINHKLFLTDYRMLPEQSALALSRSSYRYDGDFTFDRFGGEQSYKETVPYPADLRLWGFYDGEIPDSSPAEGIYEVLHNGDFSEVYYYNNIIDSWYVPEDEDYLKYEKLYRSFVMENYLDYPDNIEEYLPHDFDDNIQNIYNSSVWSYALSGTELFTEYYYDDVAEYIRNYLHSNAVYTLSPGRVPSGEDFAEYFINDNHKGYCVHFATAATLMLRRAGIPARYCEGYYVDELDVDKRYTSPDGFGSVPDSRAHAWVEVYRPLIGWQVMEFTPHYSDGSVPPENQLGSGRTYGGSDSDVSEDTESELESETDSDSETETASESDAESEAETESEIDSDSSEESGSESAAVIFEPDRDDELPAVPGIIRFIPAAVLAAAVWLSARIAVIKLRAARFKNHDGRKAARSMYGYYVRLLKLSGLKAEKGEGEEAFASRAGKSLNGISAARLNEFTRMALSARFGRNPPDEAETAQMREFLSELSGAVISSKPSWKRFIIKYVMFFD